MMRILYVAHERKLGGASISLIALVKEMKEKGHQVYAVVPTSNCPVAKKLKEMDVKIFPVFFAWWEMPKEWNFVNKFVFRLLYGIEEVQVLFLLSKLKKLSLDLVHTNSSVTDFGMRIAQKLSIKHVWHIREYGDLDYNLQFMTSKKQTLRKISENADAIIFISKDIYQYYSDYIGEKKCHVIYNGIASFFSMKKENVSKECITFLISGNLHRNKGQDKVLQAVKILNEEGKKELFCVKIAGSSSSMKDSQKYEKELKEYAKRHELENVYFLGRVENMRELRKEADVEIVASYREAFGRVTIEAMMSSNPVIGSNTGANCELIIENYNGLLYNQESVEDLAFCMKRMLSDRELIRKLGDCAYEFSTQNFTAEKNANEIEKVYTEILSQSRD